MKAGKLLSFRGKIWAYHFGHFGFAAGLAAGSWNSAFTAVHPTVWEAWQVVSWIKSDSATKFRRFRNQISTIPQPNSVLWGRRTFVNSSKCWLGKPHMFFLHRAWAETQTYTNRCWTRVILAFLVWSAAGLLLWVLCGLWADRHSCQHALRAVGRTGQLHGFIIFIVMRMILFWTSVNDHQ